MSVRYAWPAYQAPWSVDIHDAVFDDGRAPDVDADHLRLGLGDAWSVLSLTLTASSSEPVPSGLEGLRAHVLVSCPSTNVRLPLPLELEGVPGSPSAQGVVTLRRDQLAATATMTLLLSATVAGRLRSVGTGLPWTLVIDPSDAPRPPGVPPMKTVWTDFGGDDAPIAARRHARALTHVDLSTEPPTLYLNRSIDGFQQLLLAEKAQLERRRHRDMLGTMIARRVAGTVFRAAAERVAGTSPAEPPAEQMYRDMCTAVAGQLHDTDSVDVLYERLAALSDAPPAEQDEFWSNVELALDQLVELPGTVARICEEAKHAR